MDGAAAPPPDPLGGFVSEAVGSPAPVKTALHHVAGLTELAGHVGVEITTMVEELHAAFRPSARADAGPVGRGVYGGVRSGFAGARAVATRLARLTRHAPAPDGWLDVQSALNGAFGHLFDRADSGFALPMTLLGETTGAAPRPRLVVFAHGLCMNERGWRGPAHTAFRDWAVRALDADVAYLRYNSGLRISTNGARLAALLEGEAGRREIVLVGHSMGGLVARSALHQAGEAGLVWPARVRRLACLGSPHQGASLERLGNHANRMLGRVQRTRPLMRLGNLRSDGIRDLRFGHLIESDWRPRHPDDPRPAHSAVPLAAHVEHLYVAATRGAGGRRALLGDGLVSVRSALALDVHGPTAVRRELLPGLGHIGLLGDSRAHDLLREWMGDAR
jgi:hypothetical protein